ncbi:hypothetical protein GYMLUDRAFT_170962 [Collybiopsis luxurians FD-317 M1]|uniref:Uncharacterized protein n=1 Tax=Collybiopsis luxurians FD-317 M1 TaxID=944289 RepID=A0A0D0CJL0_9AGAR|nr:hypothetical protein GYMLUDRAFT_170962 [Collybiopsis luxurians FD-317 M1]
MIGAPIFINSLLPTSPSPNQPPSYPLSTDGNRARPDHLYREGEVYVRLLLPLKRGFPLWKPKPRDRNLPDIYRQEGVHIGDVVVLNEFGGFDYLFNACHPDDHPLNARGVPQNFKQLLEVDYNDTVGDPEEFKPGSYIPSRSSDISKTTCEGNLQIPDVPAEVGSGLVFRSSAAHGAFLILPEGGKRIDHNQLGKFLKYCQESARSWYDHFNQQLGRGIPNGSIYLITGFDKARAWGVVSFMDAKPGNVFLEFVPLNNAPKKPKYWFRTCNAALSDSDSDFEKQSGSVFLRGFKIAVRHNNPFLTSPESRTEVKYLSDLDASELLRKPANLCPVEPSRSLPTVLIFGGAAHEQGLDALEPDASDASEKEKYIPRKPQVYVFLSISSVQLQYLLPCPSRYIILLIYSMNGF